MLISVLIVFSWFAHAEAKGNAFTGGNFGIGRSISGSKSFSKSLAGFSGQSFSIGLKKLKNTYMQEAFREATSQTSRETYNQKFSEQQQKVNDLMRSGRYFVNERMNFEEAVKTRNDRIASFETRPVTIGANVKLYGDALSYGSARIGPWDFWFLLRAPDLFWYHHWNELSQFREHFDEVGYEKLESRIRALEQKGIPRDPTYVDPDVDPDLQFAEDYLLDNINMVYYTTKHPGSVRHFGLTVAALVIISAVLLVMLKMFSAPVPKEPYRSRIY